eukprot:TRINITY_DN67734_c7_g9_i1.p1 TRINITY_DN67734_c7_g9~~TRINITY_DN67734_c7_g9_i1.p1  ORF type:complete len:155 (+),score=19.62 TRINITY_DN67734_c7_g9_i1:68-466(+)
MSILQPNIPTFTELEAMDQEWFLRWMNSGRIVTEGKFNDSEMAALHAKADSLRLQAKKLKTKAQVRREWEAQGKCWHDVTTTYIPRFDCAENQHLCTKCNTELWRDFGSDYDDRPAEFRAWQQVLEDYKLAQ